MDSFSSNDMKHDPGLSSALLWEIQLKWNQLLSSYSISKTQEKVRFGSGLLSLEAQCRWNMKGIKKDLHLKLSYWKMRALTYLLMVEQLSL